jgi:uncharacterized protein YjbI with pentapeptide repeats
MSEQQPEGDVQETRTSACPHPEAVGARWGDLVSEERHRYLIQFVDHWLKNRAKTGDKGPFDDRQNGVRLTGADASWLAGLDRSSDGTVPDLYLGGANLTDAHLEGARLADAHMEGVFLDRANLMGAVLSSANLEGASLVGANLQGADLSGAALYWVNLEGANLNGADLSGTQFDSANLIGTQMVGANLNAASFDKWSLLNDAVLTDASFDQVSFDGTNLTVVEWEGVTILGDEREARNRTDSDGKPKSREKRIDDFQVAVRANRVLAVNLKARGLIEDADRFAYRAQVLQRQVLRRQRHYLRWAGSSLLWLISGYGYKPLRSFIAYVLIVCAFAGAYLLNAQFAAPHLTWDEALVLSVSSFHGRGFFTSGISLGDTLARLAAGEAIIGLLIEITFIATFTQRFFAR